MNTNGKLAIIISFVFITLLLVGFVFARPPNAQCRDGVDNDGDTFVDFPADPGCSSKHDNSELGTVQCDDGVDNADADTLTDYPDDLGCSSPSDNDEVNGQCDDGVDNADADTVKDYPSDLGCSSPSDNNEVDGQCDDLIDNDGDTHTDFPSDSKCVSFSDNDENPRDFCSDSDGGVNFIFQGTVSGEDNSVTFNDTDFCLDATTLREFYCDNPNDYNPAFTDRNCVLNATSTGCFLGACN